MAHCPRGLNDVQGNRVESGLRKSLEGAKLSHAGPELSAPDPFKSSWGCKKMKANYKKLLYQGSIIISILKDSNALLSLAGNCPEGFTFITKLLTEPSLGLGVCLLFYPCGIIFSQGVGDQILP